MKEKRRFNESMTITLESTDMERAHISNSEWDILIILYLARKGLKIEKMAKELVYMNGSDNNGSEEAVESMRARGYITFMHRRLKITQAGIDLVEMISKIERTSEEVA